MIGTELAHYRITARLGQGGMGEVWRATDSKLGRDVAIKVLPDSFAHDPERLARFEREAKLLASLNHPHIASIYGLEVDGGRRALVLELVEGPTLAERLAQGAPPLDEALTIARQIAEALEEAHDKGIVHRDLKPANVKLTAGGKVKVLDFGLAKALDPMSGGGSSSQLAHSPTMTLGATMHGIVLGTAAYMSPEQARGADVDRRADVWAFGVVLWEMLTGRTLFAGPTVSDTLASVLKEKPDLGQLPPATPGKIRQLLERCLRKNAHERLHSIADARIVLEEVARGDLGDAPASEAASPRPKWQTAAALALAALLGAAVAWLAGRAATPAPIPEKVLRFDVAPPKGLQGIGAPKISPDGRHIAFLGRDASGKSQIWLRSLDSSSARPIPGTDDAKSTGRPFWSPDSRFLAYFTVDRLLRVPIDGGPIQKICDARGADGSWSDDGIILFDGSYGDPIASVPASGGTPQTVLAEKPDEKVTGLAWPQFLPGGKAFLYIVVDGDNETRGLWIARSDGTDRRRLSPGISRAEYAAPGWLLFVRETTLVAQRFDASTAQLSGEAIPIADGLSVTENGLAAFSISRDGVLALRSFGGVMESFSYFDRAGTRDPVTVESGDLGHPVLSPDGRWLAFDRLAEGNTDVWLRDLRRGVSSRLTTGKEQELAPLFTPDGERLIFLRWDHGRSTVVERPLAGGAERVLIEGAVDGNPPVAVSPDGKTLVFERFERNVADLYALDLDDPSQVKPITATPDFNEYHAAFSPDGRWLALTSDESGRLELYVQPFPGPGRRMQLSTAGGVFPVWSPDGREIFFRDVALQWNRVAVETGTSFDAGVPEALFPLTLGSGLSVRRVAITPDGKRFLAEVPAADQTSVPIQVTVGWDTILPR